MVSSDDERECRISKGYAASSDSEGNSSDEEEDRHPGLIDFEELRKGMDDATARIRRGLHDDTHIYSPTEQFLYRAMAKETGRMTRSRTKVMMDETTPQSEPSKQAALPPIKRKINKQLYTFDDSDEEPLSEILLKSKREKTNESQKHSSLKDDPMRKYGESASGPTTPSPACKKKPSTPDRNSPRGNRRRLRRRKLDFTIDSSSTDAPTITCASEGSCAFPNGETSNPVAGAEVEVSTAGNSDDGTNTAIECDEDEVPCEVPEPLTAATVTNESVTDILASINDEPQTPTEVLSSGSSVSSSSKKYRIRPCNGNDAENEKATKRKLVRRARQLHEEKSQQAVVQGPSGSSPLLQVQVKCPSDGDSPLRGPSEQRFSQGSISASSSVVDIVELALSRQQKIEDAYSTSRSKNQRLGTLRKSSTSARDGSCRLSAASASTDAVMNNKIVSSARYQRRRCKLSILPGPISHGCADEIEEELRSHLRRVLASASATFNLDEVISAVKSGDVMRFRRATEYFLAHANEDGNNNKIMSVISNWRDEKGGTVLHWLCRNVRCTKAHSGDDLVHSVVKYAPGLLYIQDSQLKLPLHIAVERGEVCRVLKLLQLGSPICARDRNEHSPLDVAYTYGNGSIVKLLLNSGATFHELLDSEEKLQPLRRGHLFKMLMRYTTVLGGIMRGARKKILRNIFEVAALSPIFIAPLKDGLTPVFKFTYQPSPDKPFNGMQSPVLFTYLAVNRPVPGKRAVEWFFRCHGPLSCFAPVLNGRLLEPMTGKVPLGVATAEQLTDSFVFLCPLQPGVNVLEFKLIESYANLRLMFAAQVVLMRKSNPNPFSR